MSLFSEFLEAQGLDPTDLEPEDLKELCRDEVFRAVARWCLERHRGGLEELEEGFDPDELGLDPELDAERFGT